MRVSPPCVPPSLITIKHSTGISTCYHRLYASRPCLRSRLYPWADEPAQENLSLSADRGFSPVLSLLIPAFSLLSAPNYPLVNLSPHLERSPTTHLSMHPTVSVLCLAPGKFFGAAPLD